MIICICKVVSCKTLLGGRVGGWMDGRVEGKAGLRIAYSNQKKETSQLLLQALHNKKL